MEIKLATARDRLEVHEIAAHQHHKRIPPIRQ
jgi:hypothetical protein